MGVANPGGATGGTNGLGVDIESTYLGMEQVEGADCAKIEIARLAEGQDLDLTGDQAEAPAETEVPLRSMSMDSTHLYMDGHLYFAPDAGRLVKLELRTDESVVMTTKGKTGKGENAKDFERVVTSETKTTAVTKVETDGELADAGEAGGAPPQPVGEQATDL